MYSYTGKKSPRFQADNFCSRFFRIKLISICHFVVLRTMFITYCTECSTIQKTITNSVWPQVTSIQLYRKIHLLIVNNIFWSSFSGLGTAFFYVLNASFLLHSFKAHNVLLHSFFEFLATYETQKNDAFFCILFLRT